MPSPRLLSLATLALLACQSSDKPDISDAPFSGDYREDGKADSWRRPWNGGSLLVGEQSSGDFDRLHGWIAYEVELAAGTVDIDLADANDGSTGSLDTLLIVYGPRRPGGAYGSRALAVNDDVTPGENLNSHLLLDVPAAGTYRVLVSTYDNYAAFPSNPSRGAYRLTIKCPRIDAEGIDACGPHIRGLGQGCFDDAQCVAGAHCEGEIVCPPGTNCLWVREGACVEDYAWVSVAARQCGQNPWQLTPPTGDGESIGYGDDELEAIDRWLEDQGIQALALGKVDTEADAVCLACSCPRGDVVVVKARPADAARMVGAHGFAYAGDEWQAMKPVQCGGNPWEESAEVPTEIANIRSWASAAGARLGMVGLVHATEAQVICRACACARGDLLVVTPSSSTLASDVAALGFGPIYLP